MFFFLFSVTHSMSFDVFTGVVFPQDSVKVILPAGNQISLFGAFFPTPGSFELREEEYYVGVTTTFPKGCRSIIVSTRPTESLTFDHGSDPDKPITDLCIWYVTRPARLTLNVHSTGLSILSVVTVDGENSTQEIATGAATYLVNESILLRWSGPATDSTSFATFKAVGRDNSIPYPDRRVEFRVTDQPYYFPPEIVQPQTEESMWKARAAGGGLAGIGRAWRGLERRWRRN
jgi:hypothetical protein